MNRAWCFHPPLLRVLIDPAFRAALILPAAEKFICHCTVLAQRKALLLCDRARCNPVMTGLSFGQPCMSAGQERMSFQGHEGDVHGSLFASSPSATLTVLEQSNQFLLF